MRNVLARENHDLTWKEGLHWNLAYQYCNFFQCIQEHSCNYNRLQRLCNFLHFRMVHQHIRQYLKRNSVRIIAISFSEAHCKIVRSPRSHADTVTDRSNPLKASIVISIKFFLGISMLCKTQWSWDFRTWSHKINRPFYRYGSHSQFIRFKEYYGMPSGHLLSLSIYVRFSSKRELHCIFLGKKAIIIKSKHGTTIFF